jgi:hypothetical protein
MSMEKKRVDVGAVIDSAKFFWVPAGIALMMIIIMLSDGYDLFLMGHVGNHLVKDCVAAQSGRSYRGLSAWPGLVGLGGS